MEMSCGVVLFNSGIVLLLHYSPNNEFRDGSGHWDFSKGHVEFDESELNTALRELKEETGIVDIEILERFRQRINYNVKKGTELIPKEVIFFVGKTRVWEVSLSSEHQDFEWLCYEEAMTKLTYDNARNVLKNAFNSIKNEDV